MDWEKYIKDEKQLLRYRKLKEKNVENTAYLHLQSSCYELARQTQLLLLIAMSDYLALMENKDKEKILSNELVELFKLLREKYQLSNGLSVAENIKNSLKKLYESVPE